MPFGPDNIKQLLREGLQIQRTPLKACGWESLTIDGTVGGKALASIPSGATYAFVTVESSIATPAIRYLECGNTVQAVSSTVGIPCSNLDRFEIQGAEQLANFRAIQVGAGTHTLSVAYYK